MGMHSITLRIYHITDKCALVGSGCLIENGGKRMEPSLRVIAEDSSCHAGNRRRIQPPAEQSTGRISCPQAIADSPAKKRSKAFSIRGIRREAVLPLRIKLPVAMHLAAFRRYRQAVRRREVVKVFIESTGYVLLNRYQQMFGDLYLIELWRDARDLQQGFSLGSKKEALPR
jgi:hypothetical protein